MPLPRFLALALILVASSALAGEPAPVPDGELKAAIIASFDTHYGQGWGYANVRATFLACVFPIFQPMSDADKRVLIETKFQPPTDDSDRIATTYPGSRGKSQACGNDARRTLGNP
jgi:hypothetical protein